MESRPEFLAKCFKFAVVRFEFFQIRGANQLWLDEHRLAILNILEHDRALKFEANFGGIERLEKNQFVTGGREGRPFSLQFFERREKVRNKQEQTALAQKSRNLGQ